LWRSETFVDFEHGVNTAVKKLRQVLGDSVDEPKFIETVPKVGYRFLVPVEWVNDPNERHAQHSVVSMPVRETSVGQPEPRRQPYLRKAVLIASLTALGILVSVLLYRSQWSRSRPPEPSISLAVTSVGEKYSPSLSPDGQQLAFSWNADEAAGD
jgi:hypothetical protein